MGEIFDLLLELARERGIIGQKGKEEKNHDAQKQANVAPSVPALEGEVVAIPARERKNLRSVG
jgi:hypothetical protein